MTAVGPGVILRYRERRDLPICAQEAPAMAKFMDVHSGFIGVTAQQLKEAHEADLAIEKDEVVHFERAWLDPISGKVFCLSTEPSRDSAIQRHEPAGHPPAEVYELPLQVM